MSRYVESGTLDAGLTGKDWIAENSSDIHVVTDLVYSKVSARPARWVVAVPYDSPIKKIEDLKGKKIATEMTEFTRRYFAERKIAVAVEFSWGATEAKVVSGLADAVVEAREAHDEIEALAQRELLKREAHHRARAAGRFRRALGAARPLRAPARGRPQGGGLGRGRGDSGPHRGDRRQPRRGQACVIVLLGSSRRSSPR